MSQLLDLAELFEFLTSLYESFTLLHPSYLLNKLQTTQLQAFVLMLIEFEAL